MHTKYLDDDLLNVILKSKMDALDAFKVGLSAARASVSHHDVCDYIAFCDSAELLHIMDALIDRVASELGQAPGCEDDRVALQIQIENERH